MAGKKNQEMVRAPATHAVISLQETSPVFASLGSAGDDEWMSNDERVVNPALDGREDFPKAPYHRRLALGEDRCPGAYAEAPNGECAECGESISNMIKLMPTHSSGNDFCAGSKVPKSEDGTCQHCHLDHRAFMEKHKVFHAKYGRLSWCTGGYRPQHPTLGGCISCGLLMKVDPDSEKRLLTVGYKMQKKEESQGEAANA